MQVRTPGGSQSPFYDELAKVRWALARNLLHCVLACRRSLNTRLPASWHVLVAYPVKMGPLAQFSWQLLATASCLASLLTTRAHCLFPLLAGRRRC